MNSNLEQKVNSKLAEAIRNKDEAAKRGLRAIKAAILLANTDGTNLPIEGEREQKLLNKLIKTRTDSYATYMQYNRPELAKLEKEEIDVIEKFLPQQLTNEELSEQIQNVITSCGVSGRQYIGMIMGKLKNNLNGFADGQRVYQTALWLLTQKERV